MKFYLIATQHLIFHARAYQPGSTLKKGNGKPYWFKTTEAAWDFRIREWGHHKGVTVSDKPELMMDVYRERS